MPRKRGGRLFVFCAGLSWLFYFLSALNTAFVMLIIIGILVEMPRVDTRSIITFSLFSFMVLGDMVCVAMIASDKIFKSLWPNAFAVCVRLAYLFVASWLFYEFFWLQDLRDIPLILFSFIVASSFALINIPWIIFSLVLCVPKFRQYAKKINDYKNCSVNLVSDNNSTDCH